jgi:hypothetical protein
MRIEGKLEKVEETKSGKGVLIVVTGYEGGLDAAFNARKAGTKPTTVTLPYFGEKPEDFLKNVGAWMEIYTADVLSQRGEIYKKISSFGKLHD